MKLLLVHLSDIHLKNDEDVVLSRHVKISDAIKNIEHDVDLVVIAMTGDITFSGTGEQFNLAIEFLASLQEAISKSIAQGRDGSGIPVRFVVAPGNHDSDFSLAEMTREIVLNNVHKDIALAKDPSIVSLCTSVQANFYNFRDAMSSEGDVIGETDGSGCLCYEYRLSVGGETVRFVCLNTAWVSKKEEQQGMLVFPCEAIPPSPPYCVLNVSMLHHPYNWFRSDNARELRGVLEGSANLILTGHEHDSACATRSSTRGEHSIYVEGGMLQGSANGSSDFNVFVIDTARRKQKYAHLQWGNAMYERGLGTVMDGETGALLWGEYQVSVLHQPGAFSISDEMQSRLDDPGVPLTHRHCESVRLSDIFVWPDLRQWEIAAGETGEATKGPDVPSLIERERFIVIAGDAQSGKTSLAKRVFVDRLDREEAPLLIDAEEKLPKADRLEGYLERIFVQQYGPSALETYRQVDYDKKVIIVDNCHALRVSRDRERDTVAQLTKWAGRIILIGDHMELLAGGLARASGVAGSGSDFAFCQIQPFGNVRRNELVKKWLQLGDDHVEYGGQFVRNLASITQSMNELIGRNYVPAYPVYLLSVLQASEVSMPMDTQASTHGHFYDILIRVALMRNAETSDLDIVASYLAFLSYKIFKTRTYELSQELLEQLHDEYQASYAIRRSCESLRKRFLDQGIFMETIEGRIRFKYRFIYYYFVALYMRDHIGEASVQADISELTGKLYIDECANVMLFLAHLSKDPSIIDEMLAASRRICSKHAPASLEDDIAFVGDIGSIEQELELARGTA